MIVSFENCIGYKENAKPHGMSSLLKLTFGRETPSEFCDLFCEMHPLIMLELYGCSPLHMDFVIFVVSNAKSTHA